MYRILSWKITGGVYAYIYPVNNGKYISNRIAEDSPIWQSVINEIGGWDESEYRANFDKMAAEVQTQYGYTIAWDDNFYNFVDENTDGVNIVLLSGKDGEGVGGSGDGSGIGDGPGADVIEDFNDMIQSKLDEVREDIEKQNEEVKNFVEEKVSETISRAQDVINETKEELDNVRDELTENLKSAQEALDKASALFDFEGEISSEDIIDALSSVKEYGDWLEEYSGSVKSLQTDYDEAKRQLGSIGESESVVDGLFSHFATSLNVISGTVGNVERSMNASTASIKDFASWYDTNHSAVTEMSRFMSASAGVISDVIEYIDSGEFTAKLEESMDAKNAEMKNEIMTETSSAITNVTSVINGLSGVVEDSIVRLEESEGTLSSLGTRMDASEESIETWLTISRNNQSAVDDLRESWSIESGKLSTVASLIADTDANGNVLYFVSGATGNEFFVYITDRFNDNGYRIFTTNPDGTGNEYNEYVDPKVYTKLSSDIMSYIQQTTSSITLSVTNSEQMTAAIKLALKEDEAIISMIADEVIIDADVIAKAISAKTANIGGIIMGNGVIKSMVTKNNKPYFYLDGTNGKLFAQDAEIEGSISATTGFIGGLELQNNRLEAKERKKQIDYYKITETYSSCFSFNSGETIPFEDIVKSGISYQDIFVIEEDHPGLSANTNTSEMFPGDTFFDFGVEIGYFEILKKTQNTESETSSYTYDIFYYETKPYDSTSENTENWTTNRLSKTDKVLTTSVSINKKYIKAEVNNSGYEGWKFLGIELKNKYESEQTYALINSSNDYYDEKMGKLVIGAGPIDDQCGLNRYYKYTLLDVNSAVTEKMPITEIYLNKIYSVDNGDKSEAEVEAYKLEENKLEGTNKLVPIDDYVFYYVNESYTENGETLYRDKIYAKSTLHLLLRLDDDETGEPLSLHSPETVLGAVNTPSTGIGNYDRVDITINEGVEGGVGGTVTITPDIGGSDTGGGSTSIVLPNIGNNEPIAGNNFIYKVWDTKFTTLKVVRPVITIGQYEYSNTSIVVDTKDFNTKIYSDGTILSKNLIVDDGYFGGEINSNGVFKGELKDVTGTLKNVSITADTINSSFVINDEKSFNAVSGTKTYLKINNEKVSSDANSENWTVDSFSWDKTNKNGANAGKTYNNEKTLLKVPIHITSATTITIPSMSGYVKRYTPTRKVNKESTVYVNCYVFYDDNSVETLFNKIVKVPETRGSQTVDFATPKFDGSVEKFGDGFLIIEFGMNIHLSTYSWLGADKAAGHVYFNSNTSKVNVSNSTKSSGVHIGSDGISMFSKSGNYGIIINDSGIKLVKNGTVTNL